MLMKKYILILIILLVGIIGTFFLVRAYRFPTSANSTNGCDEVSIAAKKTQMMDIEAHYTSLSSSTRDLPNYSTEGGEQTTYTQDGIPVMIHQIFFGETGKSEAVFFLQNRKIFSIVKINYQYAQPIFTDNTGRIASTTSKVFYLNADGALCVWYQNNILQTVTSADRDLVQFLISTTL